MVGFKYSAGITKWKTYDFVIWSPEMSKSLVKWTNAFDDEKQLFNKTKVKYFTTALVNAYDMKRGKIPVKYWMDNVKNYKLTPNTVWAYRDSYAFFVL